MEHHTRPLMQYFAFATDYDGTLANEGSVAPETVEALQRLKASGRALLLVTGRELEDLRSVFKELELFDRVVAENGALVYDPAKSEERIVSVEAPEAFVRELKRRKITPLSTGRVIVATREPNDAAVLEVIREMGFEMQVIFNKGAVMVLPSGVNKATGLAVALNELGVSPHNVVGIGDAENDHAFIDLCEFSAAVSGALPQLKERVDYVTRQDNGRGVRELIDQLAENELARLKPKRARKELLLGNTARGRPIAIPALGPNVLLAGSSGGGKSTLAKTLLERLSDQAYQYCVVDPEGDYEDFEDAVVLGNRQRVPATGEVMQVLAEHSQNVAVNLLSVGLKERPAVFGELLTALNSMRAHNGRPHWLIVDEAHHVLPSDHKSGELTVPPQLSSVAYITIHPSHLHKAVLDTITYVLIVGEDPEKSFAECAEALGEQAPRLPKRKLAVGEAFLWQRGKAVRAFMIEPSRFEHRRHRRKYAEGDLGPELSFYFRGPRGHLNLRAQNLMLFAQIADGVDDETWTYHLKRHDYSSWFRSVIKNDDLADQAEKVERRRALNAAESRKAIRDLLAARYTLPA